MSSHYRKPLDWNDKLVEDAKKTLDGWYRKLTALPPTHTESDEGHWQEFMAALGDDLNVQKALSVMHKAASSALLQRMGDALGVLQGEASVWLKGGNNPQDDAEIAALIQARIDAKQAKNWTEADRIRNLLKEQGIILEDRPDGSTDWRRE